MLFTILTQLMILFLILFVILGICYATWKLFFQKIKSIEILETNYKISLSLYATIIYFVFLVYHAIYVEKSYAGKSNLEVIYFLIAIFPSIYLVINYLNLAWYFKHKFGLMHEDKETKKVEIESVIKSIEKISKELEISKVPIVLFSKYKNISPFVFGTRRRNYLSLPINWDEIFNKISRNDSNIENILKRFVIAHELSHIKHRDHLFIGLSYSFLNSFKYWIAAIIIAITTVTLSLGPSQSKNAFGPILVGIFYYLVLYLIAMSVSRRREYLADARASLIMSDEELKAIVEKSVEFKGERISHLELLFLWLSMFSNRNMNAISISKSYSGMALKTEEFLIQLGNNKIRERISTFLNNTIYSHPNGNLRIERLKDKQLVKTTHNVLSKETAIWIGILLGLFYSFAIFYPNQINQLRSHIYSQFTTNMLVINIGSILYLFYTIAIPFMFFIPLKHEGKPSVSFGNYLVILVKRYIAIYISYLSTCVIVISALYISDEIFKQFNLLNLFESAAFNLETIFQVFIGGFGLAIFLAYTQYSHIPHTLDVNKRGTNKVTLSWSLMFLLLIIILYLLVSWLKLSFLSVLFGLFSSLSIFYYLSTKYPLLIDYGEMWEIYGYKKHLLITEKKNKISLVLVQTLLTMFMPLTGLSILSNLYVKQHAANVILIYGSLGLLFVLLIKNRKLIRPSYGNIPSYLKCIREYLHTLSILDSKKIVGNEEIINNKINSYKLDNNSYTIHKRMQIATPDTGYNSIYSKHCMKLDPDYKKDIEWLFKHENKRGGFSPIAGLKPRLSSTFESLSILDICGALAKINKENHATWIKTMETEEGYFHDSISTFPVIEQTYYALGSLHVLGRLDKVNIAKCGNWIRIILQEGRNDFGNVYYSLKCIDLLGILGQELIREFKDEWLFPMSYRLKNMKIEDSLSQYYYYFGIAELVMKNNKDEIKNLIQGLEEKIYESFIYYIQNR